MPVHVRQRDGRDAERSAWIFMNFGIDLRNIVSEYHQAQRATSLFDPFIIHRAIYARVIR